MSINIKKGAENVSILSATYIYFLSNCTHFQKKKKFGFKKNNFAMCSSGSHGNHKSKNHHKPTEFWAMEAMKIDSQDIFAAYYRLLHNYIIMVYYTTYYCVYDSTFEETRQYFLTTFCMLQYNFRGFAARWKTKK